jgi:choline dehydrogenase
LQGVGQNLQEHPGVIVSTHVTQPTLNLEANSIRKVIKHGLNFIFRGRGPATTCISHAVAFVRTRSNLDWPNVQLSFTPIGYDFSPKGLELYKRACVGVAVNVCRPNGRGAISLRSADPGANPLIKHQLVGDREDLQQMIEGCRLVRKIFSAPAFQAVNGGERAPGEAVQSDEEWEQFVRASAFLMYHPSGTCAMGTGPMAVVDPQLRVHGLSGLRIADASVFPIIPSANTNAPAIMVGERAADLILGDRP